VAGAATGGLWLLDAAGPPWNSIDKKWKDKQDIQQVEIVNRLHNIGALAVDPNNPKIVYCGTGHAYHAGDSFPGVGLFKSDDGGSTWKVAAEADKEHIPHRISAIAVKPRGAGDGPNDLDRVRVGGVEVVLSIEEDTDQLSSDVRPGMFYFVAKGPTGGQAGAGGVPVKDGWHRDYFKLDAGFASKVGASKRQKDEGLFVDRDYQCHAIVHCQNEDGKPAIITAISGVLDWSGIWRSDDNGVTWEQLTRGLPPGREFGRTSLATSKADPRVVYAFIGSADGRCLGVYRTSDGGKHWSSHAGPDHFAACGRLNYTNCIAVHPDDPDLVVCGADDLHRSTDGGQTWTQVTEWFAARKSPGYAHKDHHALLWAEKPGATGYCLYSGNDGGVDCSADNGITWESQNDGLANMMFYDIDVSPSVKSGEVIAGGTQDNASVMTEIEARGIGYIPTERGVQLTESWP
jgi:photosystem II stability/assembly factor-like uncharacterized protein